eukprot:10568032-Alexandrium_andersonii.AAC.1
MKETSDDLLARSSISTMGASKASTSQPAVGQPTAAADAASARRSADLSMASKFSNASSFGAGRSTPSAALADDRGVP